jgi:hypothetical protein
MYYTSFTSEAHSDRLQDSYPGGDRVAVGDGGDEKEMVFWTSASSALK